MNKIDILHSKNKLNNVCNKMLVTIVSREDLIKKNHLSKIFTH